MTIRQLLVIMRMRDYIGTCGFEFRAMSSADALRGLKDSVWLDQGKYEQAEARYQQAIASRRAEVAGKVL